MTQLADKPMVWRSLVSIPEPVMNQARHIWAVLGQHHLLPTTAKVHKQSNNAIIVAGVTLLVEQYAEKVLELELKEAYAKPQNQAELAQLDRMFAENLGRETRNEHRKGPSPMD